MFCKISSAGNPGPVWEPCLWLSVLPLPASPSSLLFLHRFPCVSVPSVPRTLLWVLVGPLKPTCAFCGSGTPSASLAAGEHDGGRFKSGSLFVRLNFIPQPVSEKTCRATSSLRNTARWFSVTCGRGLESMIRISR